ncbi:hypothetical protein GCK72_024275 [Caenorhabditis remanei]|uniref:Uncharacterized protein n=1 Tax=Caenorhabditis remanei TaxID=31234 RepID=A0A6A5FZQ3_CAERE|nr:hypothetical protein GCK72_024275 [Caenorhabditis remanei]KAF1747809.1 hypothetical protein GCK72_024275 [Caenorhabditis remanei]
MSSELTIHRTTDFCLISKDEMTRRQEPLREGEKFGVSLLISLLLGLLLFGSSSSVLSVGVEELGESFDGTVSGVVDDLVGSSWEELDGWEGLDLDILDLKIIHLGNNDALVISVLLSELVPGWGELLAVSAPWSVELDEDVLGVVTGDLFEVLSDKNLDWVLVPILWNLLGHKVWLDGSIKVVLGELGDVLGGDLLEVWLELGHVLLKRDKTDGWELVLLESEEFHDSGVLLNIGVNVDEEDFSLELLGGVLELSLEFGKVR